jgi:phage recombination protein Bet
VTELAIVNNNIEPHNPTGGALELRSTQTQWTPDQHAALTQLGLAEATEADLKVLMHQSQRTGLDPFSRQIYMIARWDSQTRGNKWTIQTGIDGFRIIADRRPEYRGQVGPEWCGDDGAWCDVWTATKPPAAARVGVIRSDFDQPIYGVAIFREYAQYKRDGGLTAMWSGKGALMIAKCAEALALRKAFPHDLSGLVTDVEAARDDRARAEAPLRAPASGDAPTVAELTGDAPAEDPPPAGGGDQPVTRAQLTKLHAQLNDFDIKEKADKLTTVGILVRRELESSKELTVAEASGVIDLLERLLADESPAKALDAALAAIQDAEQDEGGENRA